MSKSFYAAVATFLAGAVVGGAAALLLTPKTGSELRQNLSEFAEEEMRKVKNAACRMRKEQAETVDEE